MKTSILYLFTRTPLHVGAGSSVGAIDQPIIRERHTGFPVIPGSSLKGVISDLWQREENNRTPEAVELFGSEDAKNARAGTLLLGEAKLLVFPVRSAKGCFAWLTCPLALARYFRDTGKDTLALPSLANEQTIVASGTSLVFEKEKKVIFEEYPFAVGGDVIPPAVLDALKPANADALWQELPAHLAIVSDEIFSHFAVNACEIAQHIRIDDTTGTVARGALFNQENVPSETLFYAPVRAKADDAINKLSAKLDANTGLLQVGADATTGLGWCSVKLA